MSTGDSLRKITLAVVTRDRAPLLEKYLLASLRAIVADRIDVIVVDQSADGRTQSLLAPLERARYVQSGPGVSRGRNVALEQTTGAIVAFTDDDVTLPPGWIATMRSTFDDFPDAGAVCGRAVTVNGELLPGTAAGVYRWPKNPFGLGSGFNVAFRRSALDAVGAFDEELGAGARYFAGEDTDILYRLLRGGWSVVCRDDITVVHHEEWRSFAQYMQNQYRYGIGAGAQTAKHAASGDRHALRIAIEESARHVGWFFRCLATLRLRAAAVQPLFLLGLMVGYVRRRRSRPAP